MISALKYTALATVTAGLVYMVGHPPKNDAQGIPENRFYSYKQITPLGKDTPPEPINNNELPYPIQENGNQEPIYNPNHPLQLNNPANVTNTTEYDPKEKTYTFYQKYGSYDYRPPTYMTEEEYQRYLFQNQVKSYWKSRIKADGMANQTKNGLIPKLTINSELFDRIFGGNTVDIRPSGSAELSFGFVTNRNQNPAIPVRQRKITNFDFNMKIQLNLVGKIGEKVKLTTNYNTEASFDFENQMKLEYNGLEDEIIKKIEAGNVNLPLNSSLISGSQTLFGVKTQLQFGKLTATTLFSQQRGKKTEVTIQGGAQTTPFAVNADSYEANRHFFLAQYFRNNYNQWLSNMPIISSPILITKVEVYVTNRTSQVEQSRNIVAFADLGEDSSKILKENRIPNSTNLHIVDSAGILPMNNANNLYYNLVDSTNGHVGVLRPRDFGGASTKLQSYTYLDANGDQVKMFNSSREYEVLTRARKLSPNEYTLNNRLGYISLNQSLNYDEVVAVAFQYTMNGKTYQVGEFSDQFPIGDQLIVLKMLKSTQLNTRIAMWDLMMKNVYSIGAYSLSPQDFKLDIYYNNIKTGVDIPYIPYGVIDGKPLVQVMNLDRINVNQDPVPDGFFDFIQGITINPQNGRVFFTTIEPFGNDLKPKFGPDSNKTDVYNNYIFQELYDSTKVSAQQLPAKNRYKLKGTYRSAAGNEISLNSMNVPQGSVRVTAGGVPLTENVDYTVDYTLGRVKIINESILNSGQPIKVSAENNSLFNIQQKNLIGTRLDYKVNRDFTVGGTFLRLTERPLTQKVNIGDEPVSNIMWGADYNYRTEAPWLTRLVDRIPLINTKEASSIQTAGEFAQLIPGHSKAIGKSGNSYVDDFEGSVSLIDLRNQAAWHLASIPQGQNDLFPEATQDSLVSGLNRAKTSWYTVDQSVFYQQTTNLTPPQITKQVQSNFFMTPVFETHIFPDKQPPNGQPQLMPILDVGFFPEERGPYNFDVQNGPYSKGINVNTSNAKGRIMLNNPETRWGGIMRRLETNDFQAANIEFLQIWMMDPFNEDYNNQVATQYNTFGQDPPTNGDLFINLGNVSEDILRDGHMAFENGLPSPQNPNFATAQSAWGVYPLIPPVVNAFDNNDDARAYQDVGYDGLRDADERNFYDANYLQKVAALAGGGSTVYNVASNDPSGDNYHFYRGDDYDNTPGSNTIFRYKEFNGVEGNSPTQKQYEQLNNGKYPTAATTVPNIEDLNRDNTLNETESYYQYRIRMTPQDINPNNVGNNYISDVYKSTVTMPDGSQRSVHWYQFKIPINSFETKVGTIEGFNSIRFMRMFFKNFNAPVLCRFARLELVRSDWRNYLLDLSDQVDQIAGDDPTLFSISAVNLQENGSRTPVNYVMPPGINQQQNVQTTNLVLLNEQSLQLKACNLKDGDARACYRNVEYDVRSFKNLKMNVHAEKVGTEPLNDNEVTLFVRLGSDFTNNYYEYEVPLKLTAPGRYNPNDENDRYKVWPLANEVNINFEKMTSLKLKRNKIASGSFDKYSETDESGHILTVVGNPNIAMLKTIMVGIRNPRNDTKAKCVEVWVNELRLTDFDQRGGWAANARVTAKLADFGQLALSGAYMTPFFGGIEKKVSERSREWVKQYDASSTLQMGKFFPADWKLNVPMYLGYSEIISTPQYDPSNPDVLMSAVTEENGFTREEIKRIKSRAEDYTRRRGFNLTNISKGRGKNKKKFYPWDIENFSLTYAFTEQYKRNINIDYSFNRTFLGALNYNYQLQPKSFQPFKNSKSELMNNKWMAIVKDFNVTPLPSQFSFSANVNRNYVELLNRDITSPDAKTIPQFNKTFNMARTYTFRWDLAKNLKFDLNATNDSRIIEPYGKIDTRQEKKTIADNIMKGGVNTAYRHTANFNATIPINKIPIFDFITLNYKYTANYQWQRRPFAVDSIGNTIQNSQNQSWNATFNMNNLYNKIPWLRKVNQNANKQRRDVEVENAQNSGKKDSTRKNNFEILDHIARLIMTLKQVSAAYTINAGTTLPGFDDSTKILGMNITDPTLAPGPGFVFGQQKGVLEKAKNNEWLVKRQNVAVPFQTTLTKNLNLQAKLEPMRDLRIDLTGTRTYGENNGAFIGYRADTGYYDFSRTVTGNFSISTITIGSAFKKDEKGTYRNEVFTNFKNYRGNYAEIFGSQSTALGLSNGFNPVTGKWDGYDQNQQDVIISAFLTAYTNKKPSDKIAKNPFPKIPLPNWTVTYDGLGKLKPFKKIFRSFVVRHGYRSTYSVGSFANNQLFMDLNRDGFSETRVNPADPTSNFASKYVITNVTISEQFAPLIKFDMNFIDKGRFKGVQGNFEIKKSRSISLAANIPQVSETRDNEMVIGAGYTYPNLELKKFKVKGKPIKSDLRIKVDLSFRRSNTIMRRVVDNNNQVTGGQNIITIRTAFDYVITQNVNLRLFYDRTINRPVISTSFPTQTTNAGVSIRLTIQ